jgi:hypothetical protein
MSSERTLASTFIAAFRLNSAEFAGEMQVLFQEAPATWLALTVFSCRIAGAVLFLSCPLRLHTSYSAQRTENGCLLPSPVTSDTRAALSALNGLTMWSPSFGITVPISYSSDVILLVEVSLKWTVTDMVG